MKQRIFKKKDHDYENDKFWNGQSNKFTSKMVNSDITMAIVSQNWNPLIENSQKSLNRARFNREHSIHNQAVYDRFNNQKWRKQCVK